MAILLGGAAWWLGAGRIGDPVRGPAAAGASGDAVIGALEPRSLRPSPRSPVLAPTAGNAARGPCLTGRVVDERRRAVPEATVILAGAPRQATVTREDGSFALALAAAPTMVGTVVARDATGRVGIASFVDDAAAGTAPHLPRPVVLAAGMVLNVHVHRGGRPVVGARVLARPLWLDDDGGPFDACTGGAGIAHLQVPAGPFQIDAVEPNGGRAATLVDVARIGDTDVQLDLTTAWTLELTVQSERGEAVPGAAVRAAHVAGLAGGGCAAMRCDLGRDPARTDRTGRVTLRGLIPWSSLRLEVLRRGRVVARERLRLTQPEARRVIRVAAARPYPTPPAPARTLRVEIREPSGNPVAGFPVRIGSGDTRATVRSDRHGVAECGGLTGPTELWLLGDAPERLAMEDDRNVRRVIPEGRSVVARVVMSGEARLPLDYRFECEGAVIGHVHEDPQRGALQFTLWRTSAAPAGTLRFHPSPGWSSVDVPIEQDHGRDPCAVVLNVEPLAQAVVQVAPPPNHHYQLLLERSYCDRWYVHGHYGTGTPPPGDVAHFNNLRPGRYRARDGVSGLCGPSVDVTPGARVIRLALDLTGTHQRVATKPNH
ncbi:MAG: hypothetical protein AAF628_10650 [Planctomycetota bacterium]